MPGPAPLLVAVTLCFLSTTHASPIIAERQSSFITSNYDLQGCYGDAVLIPPLSILVTTNNVKLDPDKCAVACSAYNYFGISGGNDCYCDNSINLLAPERPGQCGSQCSGQGASTIAGTCGGDTAIILMSIFKKKVLNADIPVPNVSPTYGIGCFEPASGISEFIMSGGLTIERCQAVCQGYNFYSARPQICSCFNELSIALAPPGSCTTVCSGDNSQSCGGPVAKNVYSAQPNCANVYNQLIIKNPGFENGMGFWTALITGQILWTARTDPAVAFQGRRYARIDSKTTDAYMILIQYLSLCPGAQYQVSWVGKEGSNSGCKTWPAVTRSSRLALFNDGATWTSHAANFFAPSATTEFALIIQCEGVGAGGYRNLYLDNVEMFPVFSQAT